MPDMPDLDALIPDEATLKRLHEAAMGREAPPPMSLYERLADTLPKVPPEPLGNWPQSARCWFDLMSVLGEFEQGATARQVAKRIGLPHHQRPISGVLAQLAVRGELQRTAKGELRYHARPLVKVLPALMRKFPRRLPAPQREAFELAVLLYQGSPGAQEWHQALDALLDLIEAVPGWPVAVREAVVAAPADWLRAVAALEPPSYELDGIDPLVARLSDERDAALSALVEARARLSEQEAEIARLRARLEEQDALIGALSPHSLEAFLAGEGRGDLPTELPEAEIARLRGLVLDTRADRPVQLALAAGLGAIYRAPTIHQRLTTLSFKEHPFDSLWRARVGGYRIVYGLRGLAPRVIVIGARGVVYEQTVHALRHRAW